jgi:hypothetical protein
MVEASIRDSIIYEKEEEEEEEEEAQRLKTYVNHENVLFPSKRQVNVGEASQEFSMDQSRSEAQAVFRPATTSTAYQSYSDQSRLEERINHRPTPVSRAMSDEERYTRSG